MASDVGPRVRFYGIAISGINEIILGFRSRERAESELRAIIGGEPDWQQTMRVALVDFAGSEPRVSLNPPPERSVSVTERELVEELARVSHSSYERRRVVHAVSGHGHGVRLRAERVGNPQLRLRRAAGEDQLSALAEELVQLALA
jgi:hypothetical protein